MDNNRLLTEALRLAPAHRSLADVGRAVNAAHNLDLTDAAWRGIFARNAERRDEVLSVLGNGSVSDGRSVRIYGDNVVAVLSDAHAPYMDQHAIDAACEVIAHEKPSIVILNGDMIDFYALSRYDKQPDRVLELQEELDSCIGQVLRPLRQAAQHAEMYYINGNHEERLTRYVHAHPEISGLKALSLPSLLRLSEFSIEHVDYSIELNESAIITHGRTVRKWAGRSVHGELERIRYGASVVMGHVHRLARIVTRTRAGMVWGIEAGCLCSLAPEYDPAPDWAHGMAIVESTVAGTVGREVVL